VPRGDVTAFTARQIHTFPDESLRQRLVKVWGEVRPSSADGQKLIAKYKSVLTSDSIIAADARKGRALFRRSCYQCHKLFGEGGEIGPDLTGANRANLDYILENVLTPNAAIAKD
jgi:mono/diheme cytochrome c family protein